MAEADELDELLAMLESAGSGLALLELSKAVALTSPAVSGVSTLLPLAGDMYLLRKGAPPRRVRVGELALIPSHLSVGLAAARGAATTVDSRTRLVQRGRWAVVPVQDGEEPAAQVAAARIIGSRAAALKEVLITDVKGCDVAGPLFRQLVAETARGVEGHAGFAMALMNACVVHVIRRDRLARAPVTPAKPRARHGAIAHAIAAIRAHPGDNHSIDSLATLAGMSRSSFLRGFNQAIGIAPQRYLQQVRLDEAAALLGSTALSIKMIAAQTGFASRSHFSRAFRDAFALDPSAYRRDARG